MSTRAGLAAVFVAACVVAALVASCGAAARGPDLNAPAVRDGTERTVRILAVCDEDTGLYGTAVLAGTETLVTARHVAADPNCAGPVLVLDATDQPVAVAELMADVPGADLVVLRVPGWGGEREQVCFRAPVVGEHVIALGYPGGKFTVTEGEVGAPAGPFLQEFSAKVSEGSSGGGVWADDSCLVGIVSMYHTGDHSGVMVPVHGQ